MIPEFEPLEMMNKDVQRGEDEEVRAVRWVFFSADLKLQVKTSLGL